MLSQVIQRFGDKTEARTLAREYDVPIVPGTEAAVTSLEGCEAFTVALADIDVWGPTRVKWPPKGRPPDRRIEGNAVCSGPQRRAVWAGAITTIPVDVVLAEEIGA